MNFNIRRTGTILFSIIMIVALFRTHILLKDDELKNKKVVVEGVITNIEYGKFSKKIILDNSIVVNIKDKKKFIKSHNNGYNGGYREDMEIGDKVKVEGIEKNIFNLKFKDFDYGRLLLSRGYKRYIQKNKMYFIDKNIFYTEIGRLRNYIIDTNKSIFGDYGTILNALTIGYKKDLTKEEEFMFMDSGTSHLMAVSGLHIAIITGILFVFIGRIRSIPKLFLVYIILYLYSIITLQSPSVVRAINLLFVTYIGYFFDERVDIMNTLLILASITIIENMFILYSISFQLSFLTVASISIYKKYIDKFICFDFISISVSSMIMTIPLIIYYFKEVSIMSIFGNLFIIPFIGILIFIDIITVASFYIDFIIWRIGFLLGTTILDIVVYIMKSIGNYGVNNIICKSMQMKNLVLYYIVLLFITLFVHVYMIINNRFYEEDHYISKIE